MKILIYCNHLNWDKGYSFKSYDMSIQDGDDNRVSFMVTPSSSGSISDIREKARKLSLATGLQVEYYKEMMDEVIDEEQILINKKNKAREI